MNQSGGFTMKMISPARLAAALAGFYLISAPAIAPPAYGGNELDHLKCYELDTDDDDFPWSPNTHAKDALTLTPPSISPFAKESGCKLLPRKNPKPTAVCIRVSKVPQQSPIGQSLDNDYLCFRAVCPAEKANTQLFVTENQFGNGQPLVKRRTTTRTLCVPSRVQ